MSRELAVRRLCCGEEISALRSCRPRMGWASGLLGSLHRIVANIPEEHAILPCMHPPITDLQNYASGDWIPNTDVCVTSACLGRSYSYEAATSL